MIDYAKELEISSNVRFVGRTHEVVKYMHAFDMLILPSRFEGLPLTIIEAVSNALPCIISDKVSKEAIIDGFVTSISLDNMEEWVENILALPINKREENKGKSIALVEEKGYDIKDKYMDCGESVYTHDGFAGASGPACVMCVSFSYVINKMIKGIYKKVLILATGALHSQISYQQKESIPSITHGIVLEVSE